MDATPIVHPPKSNQENATGPDKNIAKNVQPSVLPTTAIDTIILESDLSQEGLDIIWDMDISICNERIKILVDSGAHASMIKSGKVNENTLFYPQIKYGLVGISGPESSVQTNGAAYANIIQGGAKLKHQFQIAGKEVYLNYDGILGSDFMKVYKSKLDFENLKIKNKLPAWHNLYEVAERQEFEKKNPHLLKIIKRNRLIYRDKKVVNENPENKAKCKNSGQNEKVDKILQARISNFETVSSNSQPEI